MKTYLKYLIILAGFLLTSSLQAKMVVAKKKSVKVYAQASKKSNVVKTIKKGDSLESIEREGMYWKVKVANGVGYVSIMKVSHKVSKDNDGLAGAIRDAVKQGRDANDAGNTRQRSAVMGVRGLDESEETAFAGNVKPNLRLVFNMEDVVLSSNELDAHEELVFTELEKRATSR